MICRASKGVFSLLLAWVSAFVFLNQPATADDAATLTYTLKAPAYRIQAMGDGFDAVLIDGYFSYAVPGYPDLPCRIFRFAVPYDVRAQHIEVSYSVRRTENVGKFNIRELPPMGTRDGNRLLLGGKAEVYSKDAYFPRETIEYLGFSQMRKWKFINVKYTPFQYNPMSRELRYIPEVAVTITYGRAPGSSAHEAGLADAKMDDRARQLFENYSEATAWYRPVKAEAEPSAAHDYVIITTNWIKRNSTKLSSFVFHLSSRGYSPLIITEDEYGGLTGQSPDGTAERIRQWLINNYSSLGIIYVLLIGNPDPDDPSSGSDSVGDVPMKMCWPRKGEECFRESPIAYFYADLTGNWDLNGDGYFGDYDGDKGSGGVDFANEVYVGRIPVYSGVTHLDSVLTKTINYGNATSIDWRKSALMPMSFSDASTDGAHLSEAMINNYLNPTGYSEYTLYMQGTYCSAADSSYSSDQELLNDVSWQRWRYYPYGMVWWWGHGSQTGADIGYDGCPPLWSPRIIESSDAAALNDNYPSHVYQCSCLNGYPENADNLGTALLYNGAITTTSASRVSWYAVTRWETSLKYYCDNASIGYYYGQELVANRKEASKALFDVKSDMGANMNEDSDWGGKSWMNLFDFNLYGDPAASMVISAVSSCPDCPASGMITNVTYATGTTCSCSNGASIVLGSNVKVEGGATVTFTAPTVTLSPGFHAENGSTVNIN